MAPPLDKSSRQILSPRQLQPSQRKKDNQFKPPLMMNPLGSWIIQELKKFFAEFPTLFRVGNPRGGTAIILKSSLSHHHTPTPPLDTAEATSVTLTPPNGDPILITSIYISPTKSYQHIHTDLETIFGLGHVSIVCGDYNAHHTHWGGQRIDQRGYIIKNFIDTTNTHILAPPTPTRFGFNSASIIDFALTRNLLWHSQVESIAELSSDHNPILISFDSNTRSISRAKHLNRLGALSRA
ncbi:probable RNA-directed DNA polymerase from transposon X-element [Trichonephila clavipes]|nr:probable RNA-directed DNA polymerase from transposon X-element [Trichonephila clavipes]